MRPLITILLIAFLRLSAGSQAFEWVIGVETGYEMNPGMVSYSVATAPDGTIWFGGMKELVQFYHEAMGDLFLKHIDASGNELNDFEITGSAVLCDIETDADGFIYLTGQYIGDLLFWDGYELPFTGTSINSYIARISPQGNVDWALNLDLLFPDAVAEDILIHGNQIFIAHSEWSESNITEFDTDGNVVRSVNQAGVGIISSFLTTGRKSNSLKFIIALVYA
jgi:hypothetical protein